MSSEAIASPFTSDQADILIVDDTLNNLKLLADMLSMSGFRVRKAVSGKMALVAVYTKAPDLILLDINMPEMNGYEVCRRLKADAKTRDILIIFLSALDAAFDKVKGFDLGAVDYVTKPFQQEEVLKRIQNQLRIQDLTRQLEAKNQVLANTLQYLKAEQASIIQQGKMLGLSQLVSGIAHEINNPINFIAGNLNHAQDYFKTLQQAVQYYQQETLLRPSESHAGEEDAIDPDEIDLICADLPKLLQSMQTGTSRIRDIVQACQTFSHRGEVGFKPIDLHATLDSTLVLLQSRLRAQAHRPEIDVQCHYGPLPTIFCDAKEMGQVFFYLLNNAIDAIDALRNPNQTTIQTADCPDLMEREPKITIQTSLTNEEQAAITIMDNGIGIPKKMRSRIYEPFFSTKTIGSGSGLGLSISYQIVTETHRGRLDCESVLGQGSQFFIELPV